MVVQLFPRGLSMGGVTAMLRKSWEFYQHKILIALVFFVLKVCMVSNKGFKPKFVVKWPGSVKDSSCGAFSAAQICLSGG